ncbi:MAG TPA: caspase domain-containing protein [Candidatus Saccharimonadales bacterium]|nr:caspase domain-containing protein [Candidatus Saccharimonadales bacterium]
MKRLLVAAVLTAIGLPSVLAQQRGLGVTKSSDGLNPVRRIALVVGNGAYKDSPLLNPVRDAQDMAQALSQLGFEVMYKENLTQNEMKRAIRSFSERMRSDGVGLFYYAGHAVQVEGRNYLIPIGAAIQHEQEVEYEAVDVGLVLAQMYDARNRMNIVILDACRNNPFAQSFRSQTRGLASINAPSGTLIAYATAPGSVASDGEGGNGLYTQELLANIMAPGLKIEEVFKRVRIRVRERSGGKQVPWESSSLEGDFYFMGKDSSVSDQFKLENPKSTPTVNETEKRVELDHIRKSLFAKWSSYEQEVLHLDGCRIEIRQLHFINRSFYEDLISIPLAKLDNSRLKPVKASQADYDKRKQAFPAAGVHLLELFTLENAKSILRVRRKLGTRNVVERLELNSIFLSVGYEDQAEAFVDSIKETITMCERKDR